MLRNAIAVFAAGVGGADSVTVLPHTSALGLPDGFARRIARNMQGVLAEESHLWRVIDPSAGAGSIEALTDELCAKAWAAFQAIEAEGGLVAALQSGSFQRRVAEIAAARRQAIATGRQPLTGVSAFPDLRERPEGVLPVVPMAGRRVAGGAIQAPALQPARLSEPFEVLRGRAAELGQPSIFLANLGPLVAFTPRAGFARGFFEAGGIAAVSNDGFAEADGSTDLIALTDAFKASGARLACLCGTDEAYAAEATDAALALAASGATGIWLAGRPGELEAQLGAAGVGGYIFMGCDMPEALDRALEQLEAI
jgi:methylmalonyl-CoA mutase